MKPLFSCSFSYYHSYVFRNAECFLTEQFVRSEQFFRPVIYLAFTQFLLSVIYFWKDVSVTSWAIAWKLLRQSFGSLFYGMQSSPLMYKVQKFDFQTTF